MTTAGGGQNCLEMYYNSLRVFVQINGLKGTPLESIKFRIKSIDWPVTIKGNKLGDIRTEVQDIKDLEKLNRRLILKEEK